MCFVENTSDFLNSIYWSIVWQQHLPIWCSPLWSNYHTFWGGLSSLSAWWRFRITVVTHLWVYLWGHFQKEGDPRSECEFKWREASWVSAFISPSAFWPWMQCDQLSQVCFLSLSLLPGLGCDVTTCHKLPYSIPSPPWSQSRLILHLLFLGVFWSPQW